MKRAEAVSKDHIIQPTSTQPDLNNGVSLCRQHDVVGLVRTSGSSPLHCFFPDSGLASRFASAFRWVPGFVFGLVPYFQGNFLIVFLRSFWEALCLGWTFSVVGSGLG